jgi:DNA/RNA endonuclease YhcR with UshA esterase domain/DNA-directed RNA polymerase subunit RPC12/RpoP
VFFSELSKTGQTMGGQATKKNETQCPHCGRFVGPASRCAHCGMRLEKRMGLKVLRSSAVAVAIAGLLLLHLYARNRELPIVRIGDISPVMNFASVRIEGVLESDARKLRSGSVLYVVDDGSGTIAAFANDMPDGRLPLAGSPVMISGSLSVGAGNEVRMRAQAIEVSVDDSIAVAGTKLAEITADRKGERMTVVGRVSRVWAPQAGSKSPFKIVLADGGGTLEVVHWLEEPPVVVVGSTIEVSGTIGVYKDKVQLKVWEAADIRALE